MMAESVESRKFERKAVFDIPLPMKRAPRDAGNENAPEIAEPQPSTVAFSLMTKKGNKQQVRSAMLIFHKIVC
jgi:regulator of nonsense transcripts 2